MGTHTYSTTLRMIERLNNDMCIYDRLELLEPANLREKRAPKLTLSGWFLVIAGTLAPMWVAFTLTTSIQQAVSAGRAALYDQL
jgi:hypothetical protein